MISISQVSRVLLDSGLMIDFSSENAGQFFFRPRQVSNRHNITGMSKSFSLTPYCAEPSLTTIAGQQVVTSYTVKY